MLAKKLAEMRQFILETSKNCNFCSAQIEIMTRKYQSFRLSLHVFCNIERRSHCFPVMIVKSVKTYTET